MLYRTVPFRKCKRSKTESDKMLVMKATEPVEIEWASSTVCTATKKGSLSFCID